MPNLAMAPIAKPNVMAPLRDVILSLITPAQVNTQKCSHVQDARQRI
jgi:hypothetical protein